MDVKVFQFLYGWIRTWMDYLRDKVYNLFQFLYGWIRT